jgi:hypothetical protein
VKSAPKKVVDVVKAAPKKIVDAVKAGTQEDRRCREEGP